MEKLLNTIVFKYSDPDIASILGKIPEKTTGYAIYFNQNEDSFLKSDERFNVPSFPIHHDLSNTTPSNEYLRALRKVIAEIASIFPEIFKGTRYFFDPAEILRPCFIQVFKIEDRHYLYLLRLDLNIRLADSEVLVQATNDRTADYRTGKLFFESLLVPIHKPDITASGGAIPINRFFKSTWVGESGSGYHINGEWIDRELTKILSALYLPDAKRSYPYYPFKCDFNTIALTPALLTVEGRKRFLSYLHKSLPLIEDDIPAIESVIKSEKFNKNLPIYNELKKKIPDEWTKIWTSLKIRPYLNENEMKEYCLEYELSK